MSLTGPRALLLAAHLVAPSGCFHDEGLTTAGSAASSAAESGAGTSLGTTTDTGASTTDTPPADPQSICETVCAKQSECMGAGGDTCLSQCLSSLSVIAQSQECLNGYATYIECYAQVPCDQIGSMTCPSEYYQALTVCGLCPEMVTDAPACQVEYKCGGTTDLVITCDEARCTCTKDGASAGECPTTPLCTLDANARRDYAFACCSW